MVWIPEAVPLPTEAVDGEVVDIRVKQIAASDEHSAIVSVSGKLYTCGCYQFGKLGYKAPDNKNYLVQKDYLEVQFPQEL